MWTWGKGDYFRLGHGGDDHVRRPQVVKELLDVKVVDIAVGALHCVALTNEGKVNCGPQVISQIKRFHVQVYSWGDNDHGQQGNGSFEANPFPTLIKGLNFVEKIACGSSHRLAW